MKYYMQILVFCAFLTACECDDPELMIVPEELIGLFEVEEVNYPVRVECDEGIAIRFNKALLGSTIILFETIEITLNGETTTGFSNLPMYQSDENVWFIVTRGNICEGFENSFSTIGCDTDDCELGIKLFSFPEMQFGVQSTEGSYRFLDGDYNQEEGGTFTTSVSINR